MEIEKLVHMANQIAAFFKVYPEEEAISSTATHLQQYWDPRMRREMHAHVDAGGEGLVPIALAAAKRVRDRDKAKAAAK